MYDNTRKKSIMLYWKILNVLGVDFSDTFKIPIGFFINTGKLLYKLFSPDFDSGGIYTTPGTKGLNHLLKN